MIEKASLLSKVKKGAPSLVRKFSRLVSIIEARSPSIVAFSGGVDSSLLAYVASTVDGKTVCMTASSETYTPAELQKAKEFAKEHGLRHIIVKTRELDDPKFRSNPKDRCYHCKREMLAVLNERAKELRCNAILIGETASDASDYRPGHRAVVEAGAAMPLAEADLTKDDVRELSMLFGLDTWDLPANACLASRFAYGEKITPDRLRAIAKAEQLLKDAGYKIVRVRAHGRTARVELGRDEEVDLASLRRIAKKIRALGFAYITLDLEGYRSGSMNETLGKKR
ncbi:MAG: ATP-dependent sacrificial sulfur transferase LarE [Euryarchaeota archaeon]|nr:ATP-dependent sacrificial sulfur transferase LarE [Euryarchaeota archaeon]